MRKIGEFIHNGVHEISEGPYGYLILGLGYHWNSENKYLEIKEVYLAQVDMKLRYSVDEGLYEDRYRHSFSDIYKEDGKYYCDEKPILNYSEIVIPDILTGVTEEENWFRGNTNRRFYNTAGPLKYSVNPVCTGNGRFEEKYREFYACILSFDEKTLTGTAVGFDCLGKLISIDYKATIEEIYKELINDYPIVHHEPGEEIYDRGLEFSFLNLSRRIDEDGKKTYQYQSIWDEE